MSQDGRSARAKNIYDEAHKNLVDSAIELFNNPDIPNGKINLSLIAKEAGTSVATAYNHFPENLIDVFGSIFNIAFDPPGSPQNIFFISSMSLSESLFNLNQKLSIVGLSIKYFQFAMPSVE